MIFNVSHRDFYKLQITITKVTELGNTIKDNFFQNLFSK